MRITNGLVANIISYKRAIISEIILSKVWFILIFGTTRLLLVSALNNKGYSVLFSKGKATYIKDNVQYFKAPLYNKVYIIEEQAQSASAIINNLRLILYNILILIPLNISINTKESLANL